MVRRSVVAGFLLAAVLAGAGWGWATAPSRVTVRVDGNVYDGSSPWERFVEIRERRFAQREVHLVVDGESYAFPQAALGYELDRQLLDQEFEAQRKLMSSTPWKGLFGWKSLFSAPESPELPVVFTLDEERARQALTSLDQAVRRDPVDAQVLVRDRQVIHAEPGLELDVEGTLALLRRTPPAETTVIHAQVESIAPRVTDDMVLPIDVTKLLAAYETNFKNKAGARAINIAQAARYLDQTIVAPGEVFSFNRVVGRRIHERGFVDAPVIVNDEMEKDVGGGVCQVSSTLHAAAVFGNLEIVRRRSHSRPSGYAPLGLDATVIDGIQDFRFRNPYDTPILIHAYLPSKYVIRVELLGRDPAVEVEHKYTVASTTPYSRRIWRRPELGPGSSERKQKGSVGYEVTSWLSIRGQNGEVERRSYPSRYYPVPEVFWVSPDFDLSQLPPLPKGVTEVVVDGETRETAEESFDVL